MPLNNTIQDWNLLTASIQVSDVNNIQYYDKQSLQGNIKVAPEMSIVKHNID